jgi:hypothetical protein
MGDVLPVAVTVIPEVGTAVTVKGPVAMLVELGVKLTSVLVLVVLPKVGVPGAVQVVVVELAVPVKATLSMLKVPVAASALKP